MIQPSIVQAFFLPLSRLWGSRPSCGRRKANRTNPTVKRAESNKTYGIDFSILSSVLKKGYRSALISTPNKRETPTSSGVCTPRYIREKETSTIRLIQKITLPFLCFARARVVKVPVTFCVCPEGKEYPVASSLPRTWDAKGKF